MSIASIREVFAAANATTYVAIMVAMTGALMFGIDQGNFGLTSELPSFYTYWCDSHFKKVHFTCQHDLKNATEAAKAEAADWVNFVSWGGSLITLGAAAGCMTAAPWLSGTFGRRLCISFGGLTCFTGCLFASYLSNGSVTVYYIGRVVTGFGCGIACFALPVYNSEISTPAIRGIMGSMFQIMVVIGGVFASIALAFITDWRLGMMLPGLAGASVGVLIWLTPESPRFVMDKKGYEQGLATLARVRKGDAEPEARAMKLESENEAVIGQIGFGQLFGTPSRKKRVCIACYLQIAQQLTGVNAFLTYTVKIFEGAGIPEHEINTLPGYALYFNLLMLVGCVVGLILIDSSYGGRRSQLLGATCVMGPPLLLGGIVKLLDGPGGTHGWIVVVALCLYGPAFQVAWGIVPWVYPAEIFSQNEKETAVSLATFFNFLINFVLVFITPHLLNWSAGGTFVFFGLLNLSNFFFVFLCIRETKGVPLDDIPALFESGGGRNQHSDARQVSVEG